jgi:hypothetical protein
MPGGLPGEASRSEEERARGFGGGGWSFSDYMEHKRSGLDEQYASRVPVETQALAGCVVHVNGATSLPKDSLAELVHKHGGRYAQYPASGMTHFVVNVLPISKVRRLVEGLHGGSCCYEESVVFRRRVCRKMRFEQTPRVVRTCTGRERAVLRLWEVSLFSCACKGRECGMRH